MFKLFNANNFWDDDSYALEHYVDKTPSDKLIQELEQEVGYKFPKSYIQFMKRHNGGVPRKTCCPTKIPTGYAATYIEISGFLSISRDKPYSLGGEIGNNYMMKEWGYPPIGFMICDTPDAGDSAVMLDYRFCGKNGEPCVTYVEGDSYDFDTGIMTWALVVLANTFEEFIDSLISTKKAERMEDKYEQMNNSGTQNSH